MEGWMDGWMDGWMGVHTMRKYPFRRVCVCVCVDFKFNDMFCDDSHDHALHISLGK